VSERVTAPVLVENAQFGDAIVGALASMVPSESFATVLDAHAPAEALLTFAPRPDVLDRALEMGVRWVHVLATGVDNVPLERLRECVVTCSRGASAVPIAEFVLATMLAFEKQLPDSWLHEPPPQWNIATLGGLKGRTLGLVGLGAIGQEVARRALAFDMRVVAVRRRKGPSAVDGVATLDSLPALLEVSDHVVVAAPATPETHHLMAGPEFAAMKSTAHFVNVSRGSLVDQDALITALEANDLAMASLDTVEPEPLPAGHPLFAHPRVRLSAHISWSSPDSMLRTLELFIENLRRFRAAEPLEGIVDIDAGY
jgi:phosphoglycerate dehydrogenase-like enzyme